MDMKIYSRRSATKFPHARPSSWPFISGDGLRSIASCIVESAAVNTREKRRLLGDASLQLVFCKTDFVSALYQGMKAIDRYGATLVVHNGDVIDSDSVRQLSSRFQHTYCVNWLEDDHAIQPIPIGLENAWMQRGWITASHLRNAWTTRSKPSGLRDVDLLCAFSIETNRGERTSAFSTFAGRKDAMCLSSPLEVQEYLAVLKRTKLVVSPPGNGADCHRTWEAIYSGAVPVVMRRYWPFHRMKLPVIEVDDWAELSDRLNTFGVDELYRQARQVSDDFSFLDWHLERLTAPLSTSENSVVIEHCD